MWNLGLLGAAGGKLETAYDLLTTQILPGNSSTVTFNNLNTYAANYQHLQIRISARSSRPATNGNYYLRFNGDTGSNYSTYYMRGTGTDTESAAIQQSDGPGLYVYQGVTAATHNSGTFAAGVIDINDPFETTKFTTCKIMTGYAGSAIDRILLESGLWAATAAVDSITFEEFFGYSFVTGSRFSLYGLGKKV